MSFRGINFLFTYLKNEVKSLDLGGVEKPKKSLKGKGWIYYRMLGLEQKDRDNLFLGLKDVKLRRGLGIDGVLYQGFVNEDGNLILLGEELGDLFFYAKKDLRKELVDKFLSFYCVRNWIMVWVIRRWLIKMILRAI